MGKSTQCSRLAAEKPDIVHFSVGDLLRTVPPSPLRDLIDVQMRSGQLVPNDIILPSLRNRIDAQMQEEGKSRFLIDGFPRNIEQAVGFEEKMVRKTPLSPRQELFLVAKNKNLLTLPRSRPRKSAKASRPCILTAGPKSWFNASPSAPSPRDASTTIPRRCDCATRGFASPTRPSWLTIARWTGWSRLVLLLNPRERERERCFLRGLLT